MALIGEIRKRSWLLIVLIGLGMGGFLLMDMIGQKSSFGNPNLMGKINGKKVNAPEFYQTEIDLFGDSPTGDMYERRDQVWEYMIQEQLLDKACAKLGIQVSDEELDELFNVGPNLSQVIVNFFGGYQNFDVQQYTQIKTQAASFTGADLEVWDNLKERVRLTRKQEKLTNILAQAVYTPTWMAEMDNAEKTQKMNFKFVGIPFASIPDEDVKVTDGDISKYIKEHAYQYRSDEETRKASYVTFNVIPTSEDSALISNEIAKKVEEFRATEDDSIFITDNYGVFEQSYALKDALSPIIADSLFKVSVGTVVGPYHEGRQYKAVKLVDRKVVPDSVNVRHILLSPNPQLQGTDIPGLNGTADSIIIKLNAGTHSFDSLALQYSGDESNKNDGGNLGWASKGTYVPEFENMVFYNAKVGEYRKVNSQFGIHVVQVLNSKNSGKVGVKVAYISDNIVPSAQTIKAVNGKAFDFVGKNRTLEAMEAAAKEDADITVNTTQDLKLSAYNIGGLGGGQPSRDMIKWLFSAKTGEVYSNLITYQDAEFFYDNKFVVPALHSKKPKGLPSAKDIRATVEPIVLNKKKADKILSQISGDDLDAIAGQFQSSVQDANGVAFGSPFVQGMGNEPEVIGTVFQTSEDGMNKTMAPLVGNSAVFVIQPLFKSEAEAIADYTAKQSELSNQARGVVRNGIFEAMKKEAKIVDKRSRFY